MTSFPFVRRALLLCALAGLAGCSSLFSSRGDDGPRQLHVTLVGGGQLNNSGGGARPVQVCLYVVREANWLPPAGLEDSSCAQRGREVAAESRHVVAPNQVQQVLLPASGSDPVWLLADADFASKPPGYAPLRIRVDGRQLIHLAVLLERNRIVDALRPAAAPLADTPASTPAASPPPAKPSRKPWRKTRKAPIAHLEESP